MTVEDDNHCGSCCLISAGCHYTFGQQNRDHKKPTRETAPQRINSGMKI
uniref:Uncharacterized protein n=1 Tax=Wuchereria bancrofti TaxID=6293 RepID=A0AAF5Q4P6_WUCBA